MRTLNHRRLYGIVGFEVTFQNGFTHKCFVTIWARKISLIRVQSEKNEVFFVKLICTNVLKDLPDMIV